MAHFRLKKFHCHLANLSSFHPNCFGNFHEKNHYHLLLSAYSAFWRTGDTKTIGYYSLFQNFFSETFFSTKCLCRSLMTWYSTSLVAAAPSHPSSYAAVCILLFLCIYFCGEELVFVPRFDYMLKSSPSSSLDNINSLYCHVYGSTWKSSSSNLIYLFFHLETRFTGYVTPHQFSVSFIFRKISTLIWFVWESHRKSSGLIFI